MDDVAAIVRELAERGPFIAPSDALGDGCAICGKVEGQDASGAPLTTLPAEVDLADRYTEQDVAGLNKQNAALSCPDPADHQWGPAPKHATDPSMNNVAASVSAP
jgi:hypothetical protein